MFGQRFGGGRARSGRDGPVAISRRERLQLRPLQNTAAVPPESPNTQDAAPSTGAPSTSLSKSASKSSSDGEIQDDAPEMSVPAGASTKVNTEREREGSAMPPAATTTATTTTTPAAATTTATAAAVAPATATATATAIAAEKGGESVAEAKSNSAPVSQQNTVTEEKKEENGAIDEDMTRKVSELIANSPDAANEAASWYGQSLEYAAGRALRKNILDPVLEKVKDFEDTEKGEVSLFLGTYSRGKLLLLGAKDEIRHCSIRRIMHDDGPTLAMWWDGDKYLSYTNDEWSDWWIRRCHLFDPGCEMIKIVNETGETLGVAYYERNIVDKYLFEGDLRGRVTLIRGIRLEPSLNPEAVRRSNISGSERTYEVKYRGIASLLLCHILFTSLRYGSNGVAVNCPKNEVAEKFYESFMGPPLFCEEETGRRYYRMSAGQRWKILQASFFRQVNLWKKEHATPTNVDGDKESDKGPDDSPAKTFGTTKRGIEDIGKNGNSGAEAESSKRPKFDNHSDAVEDAKEPVKCNTEDRKMPKEQ